MLRDVINHSSLKAFNKWRNWYARAKDKSKPIRSFFQRRLSGDFRSFANGSALTEKIGGMLESVGSIKKDLGAVKVRTLFISDVHLGTRFCRASQILSFLKKYEAETLYLIGDIIDGWQLKKSWYWPELHEEVLRTIMDKAANGSRVVYITGNHDDFLRLPGRKLIKSPAGLEVTDTAIHTMADGKKFLLMHGDQLDAVMRNIPWLAHVGDVAYDALIVVNFVYNKIAEALGFKYHSIAAWGKASVKRAVSFISEFEEALAAAGRDKNVDGVICGHLHQAAIRNIGKMCYINTGDWVENCTAIVENTNGSLELVQC